MAKAGDKVSTDALTTVLGAGNAAAEVVSVSEGGMWERISGMEEGLG